MTLKNYWSEIKTMALNSLIHKSVRRPSINIIVCRTKKIPSPAQIIENINNKPFLFRQTFQKLGKNERKTKKFAQILYRVTVLWRIGKKRPPQIMRNSQNLFSGLFRNLDYILQYMYSYGDTKSFKTQLMSEAHTCLINERKTP